MRVVPWGALVVILMVAGCAVPETVSVGEDTNQQPVAQDGPRALVSEKQYSIVLLRPAAQAQSGGRHVYVAGIYNLANIPLKFSVKNITAAQNVGRQRKQLRVYTYEELQSEGKNEQIATEFPVGPAGGGSGATTVPSGYGGYPQSTPDKRSESSRMPGTIYSSLDDPVSAAVAKGNSAIQKEALLSKTIGIGQRNLVLLERTMARDHMLAPGEWYGGQVHFEAGLWPRGSGPRTYFISLSVGLDTHNFEITEAAEAR
jgi:hypothetical protein